MLAAHEGKTGLVPHKNRLHGRSVKFSSKPLAWCSAHKSNVIPSTAIATLRGCFTKQRRALTQIDKVPPTDKPVGNEALLCKLRCLVKWQKCRLVYMAMVTSRTVESKLTKKKACAHCIIRVTFLKRPPDKNTCIQSHLFIFAGGGRLKKSENQVSLRLTTADSEL